MKIKVNLFRVIGAVVMLAYGVISYLLFRKNNKYKSIITSALCTLSGLGLISLELDANFKPIEDEEQLNEE